MWANSTHVSVNISVFKNKQSASVQIKRQGVYVCKANNARVDIWQ